MPFVALISSRQVNLLRNNRHRTWIQLRSNGSALKVEAKDLEHSTMNELILLSWRIESSFVVADLTKIFCDEKSFCCSVDARVWNRYPLIIAVISDQL